MMQQDDDFAGLYSYLASDTGGNVGLYGSYNHHQFPPPSFLGNYDIGAGSTGGGYCSSASTAASLFGSGRYHIDQQQQHEHQHHGMMMMETASGDHGSRDNNYKALMALKNHKEAEKRRRERINSHLDRLRSLLPCNSKTDKATLLAKVVQRVRELNQQTSHLINLQEQQDNTTGGMSTTNTSAFPTSTDSYSVYTLSDQNDDFDYNYDGHDHMVKGNKVLLKASMCCEDRADLLPDLIETLDSLNLKTLRAEISTLGGRVRNVLIVTSSGGGGNGDTNDDEEEDHAECVGFLHEALKGIVERSSSPRGNERVKRRRRLVVDPSVGC